MRRRARLMRRSASQSSCRDSALGSKTLRLKTLTAETAVKDACFKDLTYRLAAQRLRALSLCLCAHIWCANAQLPDLRLRVTTECAWLREQQIILGHPQLHAALDEIHRVIEGISVMISTMSVLPSGLRPHADDQIQVLAPAIHSERHAQRQLHVNAMDGPVQLGLVDGLLHLVILHLDQVLHRPIRGELLQDRLTVPCDLTISSLDDKHVALQEGTANCQRKRRRQAVLRPLGRPVPTLDAHECALHYPHVAMPKDVHD
mmetsp:Transcript_80552/g.203676  ORF Transcript_80552/g.203676 Transcript_80552/m.203676 type:complete len:260 (+) Transcript_80552:216-995(+)